MIFYKSFDDKKIIFLECQIKWWSLIRIQLIRIFTIFYQFDCHSRITIQQQIHQTSLVFLANMKYDKTQKSTNVRSHWPKCSGPPISSSQSSLLAIVYDKAQMCAIWSSHSPILVNILYLRWGCLCSRRWPFQLLHFLQQTQMCMLSIRTKNTLDLW